MVFDLFNGCRDRTVTALLSQALQTGKHPVNQHGLLFFDGLDILVLLFLLQEPPVDSKNSTEHNSQGCDCGSKSGDIDFLSRILLLNLGIKKAPALGA